MIRDLKEVYRFVWAGPMTFEKFKSLLEQEPLEKRQMILTVYTEIYRIILFLYPNRVLKFLAYKRIEGVWHQIPEREALVDSVTSEMLESEEVLYETMRQQMLQQFRMSAIGFYADLPTESDIVYNLEKFPKKSTLDKCGYDYCEMNTKKDPTWSGVYCVTSKSGRIMLPYVLGDGDTDADLLIGSITFVPDHKLDLVTSELNKVLAKIGRVLSYLRWSSIRQYVDNIWGLNKNEQTY